MKFGLLQLIPLITFLNTSLRGRISELQAHLCPPPHQRCKLVERDQPAFLPDLSRALVIFLAFIFMPAGNFFRFRFLLLLADFFCREWVCWYGLLVRDIGWLGHESLLIRRLSGFSFTLCRCEETVVCSQPGANSVRQTTLTDLLHFAEPNSGTYCLI